MTEKTKSVTMQFPVSQILMAVFLPMKLMHVIDWDWAWVLSPLWIPAAMIMVVSILTRALK